MASISAMVGFVHALLIARRAKRIRLFDLILEPMMAMIGGMLIWSLTIEISMPDVMHAALTSLGAWGGPRTIHVLERKYFGGTRADDTQITGPAPLSSYTRRSRDKEKGD